MLEETCAGADLGAKCAFSTDGAQEVTLLRKHRVDAVCAHSGKLTRGVDGHRIDVHIRCTKDVVEVGWVILVGHLNGHIAVAVVHCRCDGQYARREVSIAIQVKVNRVRWQEWEVLHGCSVVIHRDVLVTRHTVGVSTIICSEGRERTHEGVRTVELIIVTRAGVRWSTIRVADFNGHIQIAVVCA